MRERKKISRITAVVSQPLSSGLIEFLKKGALNYLNVSVGRSPVLYEKKGIFSQRISMVSDPIDVLSLLVEEENEDVVINAIISKCELQTPGRGLIYSEEISLLIAHSLLRENKNINFEYKKFSTYSELMGICCIVQRGQGDAIAKVALDTGTCVPAVTFGEGTGVRDKLGILRITIPAEKEIINLIASKYDAEDVMNIMIDIGKLDQPGKGFIYLYPVKQGIINTKVSRSELKQVASIEQIVAALDDLKGGIEWRKKGEVGEKGVSSKRRYLENLVELELVVDEGRGDDLVKVAMSKGAAGATISKIKHISFIESTSDKVSPAREMCSMIISDEQVENIVDALESASAFDNATHGQILLRPVPKACTYLGK